MQSLRGFVKISSAFSLTGAFEGKRPTVKFLNRSRSRLPFRSFQVENLSPRELREPAAGSGAFRGRRAALHRALMCGGVIKFLRISWTSPGNFFNCDYNGRATLPAPLSLFRRTRAKPNSGLIGLAAPLQNN